MANVVVDQIRSVEETDELGSDDVYMLVFRGEVPHPSKSGSSTEFHVVGPGNVWDDFDTGEQRNKDAVVAEFHPVSLYVALLIERDNGRDVSGSVTSGCKSLLDLAWTGLLARTANLVGEKRLSVLTRGVSDALRGLNRVYMEFPYGNDDWIGDPKRFTPRRGTPITVDFQGDGGRYQAKFKVA
jgi:hypothetical protein